ncbi:MAG: Rieske 2Fe-2S domain-containing protein, partial [Acidimicrobiales bacterium]
MLDRFPFPLPYGWFAAGRVDEMPGGPVATVHYHGKDLVAWRDGDDVHVFDAHCPH